MASESDSPQAICPYVTGTVTRYCTLTPFTLTDAERFVLREVCSAYADRDNVKCNEIAAVIDGLLERTSPARDATPPSADDMPERDAR